MKKHYLLLKFLFILCVFLFAGSNVLAVCRPGYSPFGLGNQCCMPAVTGMAVDYCPNGEIPSGGQCCYLDSGGTGGINYVFTDVFISGIGPVNLQTGQTVNGTLVIEVICLGDSGSGSPGIDFGDGSPEEQLGSACLCVSVDTNPGGGPLGLGDAKVATVRCDYSFSHTYNNAGTFTVIPRSINSTGGAIGTTGLPETVYVSDAATPAPAPGRNTINPLMADTVIDVVRDITNRVFIYLSALAVLFVVIGGVTIMTAAGMPTQVTRGRKIVMFTIIGYALIILARGIATLIFRILDVNVTF